MDHHSAHTTSDERIRLMNESAQDEINAKLLGMHERTLALLKTIQAEIETLDHANAKLYELVMALSEKVNRR